MSIRRESEKIRKGEDKKGIQKKEYLHSSIEGKLFYAPQYEILQ